MIEDATLVPIELGERAYSVRIGHGEIASVGAEMARLGLGRRALVDGPSGAGGEVCALSRGTDRVSGSTSLHLAGA